MVQNQVPEIHLSRSGNLIADTGELQINEESKLFNK